MKKKNYTREEKISYYTDRITLLTADIIRLNQKITYAQERLRFLKSDMYQDYSSDLHEVLEAKRGKGR